MKPDADYLDWKNQSAELARLAAREAKGVLKNPPAAPTARAALPLIGYSPMLLNVLARIAVGALAREAIARRHDL